MTPPAARRLAHRDWAHRDCAHRDWEAAWHGALYGEGGFFTRGERPAGHFRTAPQVGDELARAVLELLARLDAALGRPGCLDLVDVGAGGGELAAAVLALAPPVLAGRLRVTGVDLAPRPPRLDGRIGWQARLPTTVTGLLVGNEWLDAVPCPVVLAAPDRPHRLRVAPDGSERPGRLVGGPEARWLARWWPLRQGWRAEVGATRDAAWAHAVRRVRAGAALAVDYASTRADRSAGRYPAGTLAGYRGGSRVVPVPDGSTDLTAHVALDACAAAGCAAGATGTVLASQRDALAALGLAATTPPVPARCAVDPLGWLAAASRAGRVAELRDPAGLGGFGWLLQTVTNLAPDLVLPTADG